MLTLIVWCHRWQVSGYTVDVQPVGSLGWQRVATGTAIGYKKLNRCAVALDPCVVGCVCHCLVHVAQVGCCCNCLLRCRMPPSALVLRFALVVCCSTRALAGLLSRCRRFATLEVSQVRLNILGTFDNLTFKIENLGLFYATPIAEPAYPSWSSSSSSSSSYDSSPGYDDFRVLEP